MADYTTLDLDTVKDILDHYDLGRIETATPLSGGRANSSSVVSTTAGRFVLSVCDEKSVTEIEHLTACLSHLNGLGYPTTRLVRTREGRKYLTIDDKPVYLKEYIEGQVPEVLNPEQALNLGCALARLHQLPAPPILTEGFAYGLNAFAQVQPGAYEHGTWLENLRPYLQQGIDPELPQGLIHGDLFADNSLFTDNKLVAILDFEEACRYFLVFDIGMCLVGCCRKNGILQPDLTRALLRGYRAVRPMQPGETAVLQNHLVYGAAATSFWRFRQYHIRYPDPEQSDAFLEMRTIAEQVYRMDTAIFQKQYCR